MLFRSASGKELNTPIATKYDKFQTAAEQATTDSGRIWLNLVSNNVGIGQTLVGYLPSTTNDFDASYDGPQIQTEGSVLSSLIGSQEMVIQARPTFTTGEVVPMSFKTNEAGTYSIAIDHVDGLFANNQNVYIKDNLVGTTTQINNNPYVFVSQVGSFNNRFELRFSGALSNSNNAFDANSTVVFVNNNQLNINATAELNNVKVYDIRGRLLFEKSNIKSTTTILEGFAPQQQVLMVQMTDNANRVVTKKVIF